jgi:hypothetical protein
MNRGGYVRIKIRGGTANQDEPSLCESCRWSIIIRGAKLQEQIVECNQLSYRDQRVTFPVVSCTRYSDRRLASVQEMEAIAWILRSDPHRNQVGFVRAGRLTDEERYVLEED